MLPPINQHFINRFTPNTGRRRRRITRSSSRSITSKTANTILLADGRCGVIIQMHRVRRSCNRDIMMTAPVRGHHRCGRATVRERRRQRQLQVRLSGSRRRFLVHRQHIRQHFRNVTWDSRTKATTGDTIDGVTFSSCRVVSCGLPEKVCNNNKRIIGCCKVHQLFSIL